MDLQKGFDAVKQENIAYFQEYTYNTPIVFSPQRTDKLRQVGQIIYKAIQHMLKNYRKYLPIMPMDDKSLQILEICDRYPSPVGTFRTDFVIDQARQTWLIEMGTRHPLDGYFTSGFFHEIALRQAEKLGIRGMNDLYSAFFPYLENIIGDARYVCAIKGNDKMQEIRLYPRIFEQAGIPCHIIPIEELPAKLDLLPDAWVIEELNFPEIRSFPADIIEALAACRLHNAIKTILFTHDKRFYQVLNHPAFLQDALLPQERELLAKFLLPTYVYGDHPEIWEQAYASRDAFILKHQLKGKSVDIYAGCLTDEPTWKKLFEPATLEQMVLQPFVTQKVFDGFIGSEPRRDYATGTLLFFNQEFFGPGLFRTSSLPVSGLQDFRKIAMLVADVGQHHPDLHVL